MRRIINEIKRKKFNYKHANKLILLKKNVEINNKTNLAGNNTIYDNTNIKGSNIGFGTYISSNCNLNNTEIGKFTCVGPNVKVVYGTHPVKKFVSVHPAFFSTKKQAGFTLVNEEKFIERKFVEGTNDKSVVIGNDVWIGQDALILEGITIADGSVIGAGAIVTKSTKEYSINIGFPAREVGYRFEDSEREFLNEFKWWNKDWEWILDNKVLFENIEEFYEAYKQKK